MRWKFALCPVNKIMTTPTPEQLREIDEHPILFSGAMVRAVIAGRKTQTRRLFKLPSWAMDGTDPDYFPEACHKRSGCLVEVKCPFGQPGDRLWVRESFYIDHCEYLGKLPKGRPSDMEDHFMYYAADGDICGQIPECDCSDSGPPKIRPSLHMPRWASRITLEVLAVRVERLQEISIDDAIAEGVDLENPPPPGMSKRFGRAWAPTKFQQLWDSLASTKTSWKSNPYVWVLEFRVKNCQFEKRAKNESISGQRIG